MACTGIVSWRNAGMAGSGPIRFRDVVPRERDGAVLAGELELPNHVAEAAERHFGTGEVEFEDAAEPLVVKRADGVAIAAKRRRQC